MRTLAIAAFASLSFAWPAHSQEWSGWHAGANVGFTYSESWSRPDGTASKSGASVGLTLGHWWQVDPYYLGMDVGLSFGGASRERVSAPGAPGVAWKASGYDYLTASFRMKLGVPVGSTLVYGAAGVDHTRTAGTFTWAGAATNYSDMATTMPTVALGVDAPLADSLSLNAEVSLAGAAYNGGDRYVTSVRGLAGLTKHFN